jgi:mercuric reductase
MTVRHYRISVAGMTCTDCERHVADALRAAGAHAAHADFRRGAVTASAPEGVSEEQLGEAIRRAGYRPTAVQRLDVPLHVPEQDDDADYDLAIIGSGAAAFAAAIAARERGARVVMVEQGTVGGTCVNVGCVPSKALLRAAEVYHLAGHHPFAGIETRAGGVDLRALVAQKDELLATLRQEKYLDLVPAYGWELRQGHAEFLDERALTVDGEPLTARAYLIATGAAPFIPPIAGLAESGYLTSTTALELQELPVSMAVIGGNAIGLELGQAFARLGTRVTVLEVLDRIAPFEEPEVSAALAEALAAEGMTIVTGARVTHVERLPGRPERRVGFRRNGVDEVLEVDEVLVATGRRPNTAGLGLERAGITTDHRGAVVVDATLRTTNPRVWAAGDVTPAPQFVYLAAYQGKLAAENALTGAGRTVDLTALPRITFTSPSVAAVGLTEAEARAAGYAVRTSALPLHAVTRAVVNRDERGLFKLVAEADSGRILGVHILAENAGDVIYAAELAVKFRLTVDDLVATFGPYLTTAEGLRLAAQAFARDVSRLSCCAG